MSTPLKQKGGKNKVVRREPPFADYHDEVTDQHFERINDLVDQEQFDDSEEVCEPAW